MFLAGGPNSVPFHARFAVFREGKVTDVPALDAKRARKVPKNMIGRVLSDREVTGLLDRLA
jgi:hypothetical protein